MLINNAKTNDGDIKKLKRLINNKINDLVVYLVFEPGHFTHYLMNIL